MTNLPSNDEITRFDGTRTTLSRVPNMKSWLPGTFTQIRSVRIGELEMVENFKKNNGWGLIFYLYRRIFFNDVGDST